MIRLTNFPILVFVLVLVERGVCYMRSWPRLISLVVDVILVRIQRTTEFVFDIKHLQ